MIRFPNPDFLKAQYFGDLRTFSVAFCIEFFRIFEIPDPDLPIHYTVLWRYD